MADDTQNDDATSEVEEQDGQQTPQDAFDIVGEVMREAEEAMAAEEEGEAAVETDEKKVETGTDDKSKTDTTAHEPTEDEKFDARLKELGIDLSREIKTDNKLPYSRAMQIVRNQLRSALTKVDEAHGKVLQERDAETGRFKAKAADADAWKDLIAKDPQRTLLTLASLFPDLYSQYVKGEVKKETSVTERKAVVPKAEDDPEPKADQIFPDKTKGYSEEQWTAWQEWNRRQIRREIEADLKADIDARVGPLEHDRKAEEAYNKELTAIRAQIAEAREHWGDLYTKYEGEIVKVKAAADQAGKPISVLAAATRVCKAKQEEEQKAEADKLRADRNKIREEIIAEQNKKATAGRRTASPTATRKPAVASGPKSTFDLVGDALEEAGESIA